MVPALSDSRAVHICLGHQTEEKSENAAKNAAASVLPDMTVPRIPAITARRMVT
jgi:hypothetical protein